jgi:hypothetical protein
MNQMDYSAIFSGGRSPASRAEHAVDDGHADSCFGPLAIEAAMR